MPKLSEAEILERLPNVKDWERHGDMLVRSWQFPSFRSEKADHHPDMIVSYRNVRMELSSHDAGGLTDRDFALAAQINDLPTDR
jgi:4a-hydroxytetrahydrobiopterin dehydratase